MELGVVIGKQGKDIPVESAFDYVAGMYCGFIYCIDIDTGYTLALDLTARDLQAAAKTKVHNHPNKRNMNNCVGIAMDSCKGV